MMVLLYMITLILNIFMFNCWYLYQFMFSMVFMILLVKLNLSMSFSYIFYDFGLDFVSFGLVMLCIIIFNLMIMSSNLIKFEADSVFFLMVSLFLSLMIVMFFFSLNLFFMYIFFELSLIFMIIMLLGWGYQPERLISGFYLLFYTIFSSLPFFLLILYLYGFSFSFFFDYLSSLSDSFLIYFIFMFSFLVKAPMFIFHFWLPKAHVQASVAGSMILAGLMLKLGGYGIIRFMFIFELGFNLNSYIVYSFVIWGSLLVSLICFIQGDMKMMVAYSSVSHMGLCLLGMMSMSLFGLVGSYILMIGHGICSSGLFCLANIFYSRINSRSFFMIKGMILYMPSVTMFWFLLCSFNMSCPPSLNFIGEILILSSMIQYWGWSFIYFILISFLGSCFCMYLYLYSQHGMYMYMFSFSSGETREYLVSFVHVFMLVCFILLIDLF
uniref:NADH-ubiquinone oxidoreductase chain 4 n=1 Tax=Olidiana ritcheriina TaxID=1306428 RepID=A0A5Q0N5B9_9HEMI|nr:NADH dehydrogenase subunit 4 [Olidiana ritcheriina]QFZ99641.1 NADH dehydrogenase subunit 4 [Olidiana ritcheriina]